jgi:hypothetical protein
MSKTKMVKGEDDRVAVLITTDHTKRGVFAGFINREDVEKENIEATEVRMCVYWTSEVKGVLGLAATGPDKGCRISKAVPKALIKGVTAVVELTPSALKNWRAEPWGN